MYVHTHTHTHTHTNIHIHTHTYIHIGKTLWAIFSEPQQPDQGQSDYPPTNSAPWALGCSEARCRTACAYHCPGGCGEGESADRGGWKEGAFEEGEEDAFDFASGVVPCGFSKSESGEGTVGHAVFSLDELEARDFKAVERCTCAATLPRHMLAAGAIVVAFLGAFILGTFVELATERGGEGGVVSKCSAMMEAALGEVVIGGLFIAYFGAALGLQVAVWVDVYGSEMGCGSWLYCFAIAANVVWVLYAISACCLR